MKNCLITGASSGLGKFLFENIHNAHGLHRDNFHELENRSYDLIVHCAFNKENTISNHKKYLEDNIILTQKLKKIDCKKFVYISSIDVYSQNCNFYTTFKKFSECLLDSNDLILRCSAMVGKDMKTNHLVKLHQNSESITLSKKSTFNYILYSDILKFLLNEDVYKMSGVIDFVSNESITIGEVAKLLNSNTHLGDYEYSSDLQFTNPIYNLNEQFNKSSLEVLREYYGI